MIRPVVDSLLAQVPARQREAARTLVADLSEAQAVDALVAGWNVKADQADITRRIEAKRRATETGHNGGVKTARKRRMGLLPSVNPAGKLWKPDLKSPLNKAVFPRYGKIPRYVPPLVRFMSPTVRGTIIIIGDVVDHLGDFNLPRATHAERIGASKRKAYAALETLEAAGLLVKKIPGNREQATIWSYTPVADVDLDRARRVLQAARHQASKKASAIRESRRIVAPYGP